MYYTRVLLYKIYSQHQILLENHIPSSREFHGCQESDPIWAP